MHRSYIHISPVVNPLSSRNRVHVQFLHTVLLLSSLDEPMFSVQDDVYVRRLERLCDAAVKIVSFTGQEPNPLYQDYHGQHTRDQ